MATTRIILNTVRNRQISFFGHAMRIKEIESIIISGEIEGKRCKGRQIIAYTKSLSEWMNVEEAEMIRFGETYLENHDRQSWEPAGHLKEEEDIIHMV